MHFSNMYDNISWIKGYHFVNDDDILKLRGLPNMINNESKQILLIQEEMKENV